jgi:cellobiose phosphorylase
LPTGAESLFTANLYGKALLEMIALYEHLDNDSAAHECHLAYDEMKSRVESIAWDGEWYVRYFDDEGNPLGSSKNIYGQISLNAQSWPVFQALPLLNEAVERWIRYTKG